MSQLYQLPVSSEKRSVHYILLSAIFNPLHGGIINDCLKSTFVIKVASMKKYGLIPMQPSCATAKSTLLFFSKDKWNTKEDSMKNALYVL